jgi:hypothetical protein
MVCAGLASRRCCGNLVETVFRKNAAVQIEKPKNQHFRQTDP